MAKQKSNEKMMPAIPDLFYRSEWRGWSELIEIIKFNYNGLGDAIALCDGRTTYIHLTDLNEILFGSQYGGWHYDTVSVDDGRFVLTLSQNVRDEMNAAEKPKKKTRKSSKNVRKKKTK
jgi:hypothetical protein